MRKQQNIFTCFFLSVILFAVGCSDMEKSFEPERYQYPEITLEDFSPKTGKPGTEITITGTNFGDRSEAVSISFNGVKAEEILSCENTAIVVPVPDGALDGPIIVTVWTHTKETAEDFIYQEGAKVYSITPEEGDNDEEITIIGENFGTDKNEVKVLFPNEIEGNVISVTNTQIIVTVPDGTKSGNLTIIVGKQVIEGPYFKYGNEFNSGVLLNDLLLTGNATIIGTSGSYGNNPETTKEAAFDKDLDTFFDSAVSSAWLGLDLGKGTKAIITAVRFAPRSTHPQRMVGGKIQGSHTADFADPVDLFEITEQPAVGVYTIEWINHNEAFRYVRYHDTNSCNVAEMEFYGIIEYGDEEDDDSVLLNELLVTGNAVIIGTEGSWSGDPAAGREAVFDGDLDTYFDGPVSNCWAGLDLGEDIQAIVTSIRYAPRSTHPQRMINGKFQGSHTADFSNPVDLYQITEEPAAGVFTTIEIIHDEAFRYVRYHDTNSCNVAELEFYGILK